MAWGFGTWDANGVDNNTGLVKINALTVVSIDATSAYSFTITPPAGYSLDFMFQPSGEVTEQTRRKKIQVSGSTLTVTETSSGDFSNGTYPMFSGSILVFAR